MKETEALEIIRLLTAGFHRESIEPETIQLWVEVIEPYDAEIATRVALSWVKSEDQFPSLSQFRHAYSGLKKREQPVEPELSAAHDGPRDAFGLPLREAPLWVRRRVLARAAGDFRVFPEQIVGDGKYRDDPRFTLAEAEELGVMPEDAWLEETRG